MPGAQHGKYHPGLISAFSAPSAGYFRQGTILRTDCGGPGGLKEQQGGLSDWSPVSKVKSIRWGPMEGLVSYNKDSHFDPGWQGIPQRTLSKEMTWSNLQSLCLQGRKETNGGKGRSKATTEEDVNTSFTEILLQGVAVSNTSSRAQPQGPHSLEGQQW